MRKTHIQKTLALGLCLASLLAALCLGVAPERGAAQGAQPVETKQASAAWFPDPHPILNDLPVRQAMAYCTDKLALIQSVYPLLSPTQQQVLLMNTMIPRDHWAYAGDANISLYPHNQVQGESLLEQAGWTRATISDTYRTNAAGEELAVKITTTTAAIRQTWAAEWEQQMRDCGIRVVRYHVPASWWFGDTTGLQRRDFELGGFAWVGEPDPGGRTMWACDQIPTPENGWQGQNYMGWCNTQADSSIIQASTTLTRTGRIAAYRTLQQAYTTDVPALPLFQRSEIYSADAAMTGFNPQPGESNYTYNAGAWAISGRDTITHATTQEPGSLFGLVETASTSKVLLTLIGANTSYTTLNYDFQPTWLVALPTLENGRTQNNTVLVSQGAMVVDANDKVVSLQPGVVVVNAVGQRVTYSGGAIQMKQLVVNYEYRADLRWPDGQVLSTQDIQLGYQIDCSPASGAASYDTCNRTQSYTVSGRVATQTLLPGEQSPVYFSRDFHLYPAHRPVSGGRTLGQVPTAEWATLPEVAEKPWGFGPYVVANWVQGEKIELEAHDYWYGGTPITPNYRVRFYADGAEAENDLVAGLVDVLGPDVLFGLDQVLVDAEQAGLVENTVLASPTWEHIDMNLQAQQAPNPVMNDRRLRQAVAYCTNRRALAEAAYPGLTPSEIDALMLDSVLPKTHWAYVQPSALYPFNQALGETLLEQAGWNLQDGALYRTNSRGEELALKFTTSVAAIRQAWAAVWEQQMQACGLRVVRLHAPADWFFGDSTGVSRRDFDLAAFAWNFQVDQTVEMGILYAYDQIPSAANGWQGQNYIGWYNPVATNAAHLGDNQALSQAERKVYYGLLQEQIARDVPTIPLFLRADAQNYWEHIDFNLTLLPQVYAPSVLR